MKNISLFPFRRNKYFFGKLLTVRDFEAEQLYFNNKRRLLNTLICGSGVVCGLTVTRIDGASVAVESGMAIDGAGREIVVAQPVIARLSELDGFAGDTGLMPYAYLCIEYDEFDREPMHSVADSALDENRHGKTEEGFRLFLSYSEPEDSAGMEKGGGLYSTSLEKLLGEGLKEKLYIARIHIVRWESAYEIGEIEQVPFGQHVTNAAAAGALRKMLERGNDRDSQTAARQEGGLEPAVAPRREEREDFVRYGVIPLVIPKKARPGDVYFSAEEPHGLGPGAVHMSAGIMSQYGAVYGAPGIFEEDGDYECALRTNTGDGTFQVGVRVGAPSVGEKIDISWMACRDWISCGEAPPVPHILIEPNIRYLAVRETSLFSCRLYGLDGEGVTWQVREPEGGDIDGNGVYTAPNTPGIYEILASAAEHAEVTGSAFAVVKER